MTCSVTLTADSAAGCCGPDSLVWDSRQARQVKRALAWQWRVGSGKWRMHNGAATG
jgi:hypothetical protein